MLVSDYLVELARTNRADRPAAIKIVHNIVGLCGEAGEFVDLVKKHVFHGHAVDREKLLSEAGDVIWYSFALAEAVGLKLVGSLDTVDSAVTPARLTVKNRGRLDATDLSLFHALQLSSVVGQLGDVGTGVLKIQNRHARDGLGFDYRPARDSIDTLIPCALWHVGAVLNMHELTLSEAAEANVKKLRARYPNGWSQADSVARVDVPAEVA